MIVACPGPEYMASTWHIVVDISKEIKVFFQDMDSLCSSHLIKIKVL